MYLLPIKSATKRKEWLEKKITKTEKENAENRVLYYNKLTDDCFPFLAISKISDLKKPKSPKTYYHDTYEYARFFAENLPINFSFGDVIDIPERPAILKSRPIYGVNKNSVLLNLDKIRHFVWVKNDKPFIEKKDMMIGRGAVFQQHRYDFFEKYFNHPLCDLGQVNKKGGNPIWIKPKISIKNHLDFKFILSLEGNDVATNLKWIMSSNSIAVMPKPKYETWFMEGILEGGVHFIEIQSDYSDLEEQLSFYIGNPEKCLNIIKNAHQHCEQFFNKYVEDYCSLRVLEKYLKCK